MTTNDKVTSPPDLFQMVNTPKKNRRDIDLLFLFITFSSLKSSATHCISLHLIRMPMQYWIQSASKHWRNLSPPPPASRLHTENHMDIETFKHF